MRVLRIYHAGRDGDQRLRDHALARAGADVTLIVPRSWPGAPQDHSITDSQVRVVALPVQRSGDVNRHRYEKRLELLRVLVESQPQVVDIHEEPFSIATRQCLSVVEPNVPVVIYTAQNLAKRLPPPFLQYEREAYNRAAAIYPCSLQAAAVARGKGFEGHIEVLPLGYDDTLFFAGHQQAVEPIARLALVGRLVPEKGVRDAVRILHQLLTHRRVQLTIVGSGPESEQASRLATELGVTSAIRVLPWQDPAHLAALFRDTHVVLVPSSSTHTWVEQFGRVIVEGQASGAVVAGYASGAIPEVAGAAGLLAPEGKWLVLAKAIADLLSHPLEFEQRRQCGLAQSQQRTWDVVARQQLSLYRRAVEGDLERLPLPASPRARRAVARREFGPSAVALGGGRPFALPLLRKGGWPVARLGTLLDLIGEASARRKVRRGVRQ